MTACINRLLLKDPVERPRTTVFGAALLLFGAVIALRFAVNDPSVPILLFSLVPIAILAIELGLRGGIVAGTVAVAAVGAWSVVGDVRLTPLAFTSRLSSFFLVGLLVGLLFERLQAAREAQRRLFESSLDPAIGLSIDGRVTCANSRALALFGRRRPEMVGHEIEQFLPGFFSQFSQRTPEDGVRMFAFQLLGRNDAGTFPVEVNVAAWQSEDGALLVSLRR
jgi:PAS domain S-box-containing protein